MVTIYRVNDKEFNTYEDAKAYEEELEQKNALKRNKRNKSVSKKSLMQPMNI